MPDHLIPAPIAMPPPASTGSAHDRHRLRGERVPPAGTVVAAIILAALGIVLALTLVASAPPAIAAPVAILLIGGLLAGSRAMRTRAARLHRVHHVRRRQSVPRRSRQEAHP